MPGVVDAAGSGGEPRKILKLDEDVVNRIAAGEVVQRPANAVKELMENSLDAGSTSITVTAKQGGLKLLQIQDNGHGIRREDLPIVCERFTTSKLREFGDLRTMSTFGFRGEALASITHTAKVTITSKTPSSHVAYKAKYSDGRLVAAGPGQSVDPKPCAGVTGTTIQAEDLFYNMDTRRRAFKNPGEQYKGILDVVTRYAIHFGDRGVAFTCKKHGKPSPDLHTPQKSSRLANIRVAFGPALSKELVELKCSEGEELLNDPAALGDEHWENSGAGPPKFVFKAEGLVSGPNYSAKRSDFILFINDRLVESPAIKKAIEGAYKDVLPKSTHPFVYLGITMPRRHLDVNVHPTKREVHFLHQEQLLECLHRAVELKLEGANQSRTFYSQVILPDMDFSTPEASTETPVAAAATVGIKKKKSRDVIDASSPDTEAEALSLSGGGGENSGGNDVRARSSRRPSPPARSVDLDTTAEDDRDNQSQEDEEEESVIRRKQTGRGESSAGRKRGRGGDEAATAAAAIDFGSFSSSSPGGRREGRRGSSPRGAGSEPSSSRKKQGSGGGGGGGENGPKRGGANAPLAPQKLVRTDRTAGNLDAFLQPSKPPAMFSAFDLSSQSGARGAGVGRKNGKLKGTDRGSGSTSRGGGSLEGGEEEGEEEQEEEAGNTAARMRAKRRRKNDELGSGDDDTAKPAGAAGDGPVLLEAASSGGNDARNSDDEDGDDENAIMCVCPTVQPPDVVRGDEEEGEEVDEEEEEGEEGDKDAASETAKATRVGEGRGKQHPSHGSGSVAASTASAVDKEREDRAEERKEDPEGEQEQPPNTTTKAKRGRNSKSKRPARPFAGIPRLGHGPVKKNCDCCGGMRPRGPDGSIVLTEGDIADVASATGGTSSTPGDAVDGDPRPGPNQAAVRAQQQHKRPESFVETNVKYHSVRSLIADFRTQAHKGLTQMLKKYSFVGMVDLHLSLVQFNTKLILVNHTTLSKETFFQMSLRRFNVMPRLPLASPLPVLPLIRAAFDLPEAGWTQLDGDKDELAEDAVRLLEEKSPLLDEYFMIKLSLEHPSDVARNTKIDNADDNSSDGGRPEGGGNRGNLPSDATTAEGRAGERRALCICSLPLLLEGHTPVGEGLPMFLLRLATEVDFSEERTCFEGIATELSLFYSTLPLGGEETALTPPTLTPTPGSPRPTSTAASSPRTPSHQSTTDRAESTAPRPTAAGSSAGKEKDSARKGPAAGAGAGAAGAGRREELSLAPSEATAVVQHILYPAFRWALLPPQAFATDGTVLQLACLERLYKVFERC